MATNELRPLGIGEILDAGIKLCMRHWRVFALCVLAFVIPLEILNVLVQASVDPAQLRLTSDPSTSPDTNDVAAGGQALLNFLSGLILAVSNCACYQAVSDAWLGTEPDAGRSLRVGLRRLLPYIGLSIVATLALLGAAIALVIPAIWLGVAWSVAGVALVLEREGPLRSLGRSFGLIRGRWWATFATFLVAALLVFVIILVIGLALGALVGAVIGDSEVTGAIALVIIDTIAYTLTIPYLAAVAVLIYYDRRVRKEGLDLQMRVGEAGEPAPRVEPEPATAATGGWAHPAAAADSGGGWSSRPADGESTAETSGWARPAGAAAPGRVGDAESPGAGGAPPTASFTGDDEPTPPPRASAGDEPSSASAPPGDEGEPASASPPAPGEDDEPEPPAREREARPDPNRADWLPPEEPQGPGGL